MAGSSTGVRIVISIAVGCSFVGMVVVMCLSNLTDPRFLMGGGSSLSLQGGGEVGGVVGEVCRRLVR